MDYLFAEATAQAGAFAQEQGLALDEEQLGQMGRVWAGSDYLVQSLNTQPELLTRLLTAGQLHQPPGFDALSAELTAELEKVSEMPQLQLRLRRFRRLHMLRIIWRDLAGLADIEVILRELSDLADVCIQRALDWLYRQCVTELGQPTGAQGQAQPLVVLGMGKLGARELNLSSDIDLIFAYPESGQVVGGRRQLANEQFFQKLCQRLVQSLNSQTADGFVYRVDTRLRPYGEAGPLAMNFAAMEAYYEGHARDWERYAMIKARVVAGDAERGAQLLRMLQPFIYRKYLDFGAIEAIRDMKRMIAADLHKKGMEANIKLGSGGIREIEFIGQAFQLIRGGRDPGLRRRGILPVLQRLGEENLLPEHVVRHLTLAYRFLRRVENRLQAWRDRQTHLLPEKAEARHRLAAAMGYSDWESLAAELSKHRLRVQGYFDQVFAAQQDEADTEDNLAAQLWLDERDDAQLLDALAASGHVGDPQGFLDALRLFRQSSRVRTLSARGRGRMDQLMPNLLNRVLGEQNADILLPRLLDLLDSIARRTSYLSLLIEHPIALSQLVRLIANSSYIFALLKNYPILLDELLDARSLYTPIHARQLEAELDNLMAAVDADDLEEQMERLRQFSKGHMLRVAAADLADVIPVMKVSDYLTEVAEVTIVKALAIAWRHFVRKHGQPSGLADGRNGFAVIGYGKLGGIELGYGSDLDLVFLQGAKPNGMTLGDKSVSNEVFYARFGQRLVHMFNTFTPSGVLYELDMRLRPNGKSGMLISHVDAFEQYQHRDAWVWEHQALLRARPIAGDPDLMERFSRIRREVLSLPRETAALRREVRDMREKMRSQLDKSDDDSFDLKQGRGGIADIEFMVQYSVLKEAHRYPDLLDYTDNVRLLEGLRRHGLLPESMAEELLQAYLALRTSYHHQGLQDRPAIMAQNRLASVSRRVTAIWRQLMEEPEGIR